jgi:hypothetical protein
VPRTRVTEVGHADPDPVIGLLNTEHGPEATFAPNGEWPQRDGVVDGLMDPRSAAAMLRALQVVTPPGAPDGRQLRKLREIRSAASALAGGRRGDYEASVRGLLKGYVFTLDTSGRVGTGARGWDALVVTSLLRLVEIARDERIKRCRNSRCRWAFVDDSHNGRRVWCEMATCGNRDKVARFRRRQRRRAKAGSARGSHP